MKNLYIDFDGVISDTIEVTYKMIEEENVSKENINLFYQNLDWQNLLEKTPLINNSMIKIEKIIETNKYDVAILTHVTSQKEAVAKIHFIRRYLPDITIIAVPKEVSKTQMVSARNSILVDDFTGNLDEWAENGGIGIKFSKINKKSKYLNITDLEQILALDIDKC